MNKTKKDPCTAIVAHIDLLGFSNHLILANHDLKSKIGKEAINRLEILERAISLLKRESKKHPEFYPPNGVNMIRFNDSIMLGIDIDSRYNFSSIPYERLNAQFESGQNTEDEIRLKETLTSDEELLLLKHNESYNIAFFLGIVARIHDFINIEEERISMPGCRTVVSSGIRYPYKDFYSANFALSNAFIANEKGKDSGFEGNRLYCDTNVAAFACFNRNVMLRLFFAKFTLKHLFTDPYINEPNGHGFTFEESKKFSVKILDRNLEFRPLNSDIVSDFQTIQECKKYLTAEFTEHSMTKAYMKVLTTFNPDQEHLNNSLFYLWAYRLSLKSSIITTLERRFTLDLVKKTTVIK